MVVIDQEEVVKVSGYGLGRLHQGIHIKLFPFRKRGECAWQHACLDPVRDIQLCAQTLLLLRRDGQIVHVPDDAQLHLLDISVQIPDLVISPAGNVDDLCLQIIFILGTKRGSILRQPADRVRDDLPDIETAQDCHEDEDSRAFEKQENDKTMPSVYDLVHIQVNADDSRIGAVGGGHRFRAGAQPAILRIRDGSRNLFIRDLILKAF